MAWLALYSMGQATDQATVATIFTAISAIGCGVSFLITRALKTSKWASVDGWIILALATISICFQFFLDRLLPGVPFENELWTSGFLSWTIALSCFAIWRDQSRLFITVPAIALFGLVGIYDTFGYVLVFFFVFLLLLALLFGRAHARSMLRQALDSGYNRIEQGSWFQEGMLEQDEMLKAMRKGTWKWMAGPEWAIGSAAAVILLSLLGAPVIQESMKSITGSVLVRLPTLAGHFAHAPNLNGNQTSVRIGTGPISLKDDVVGIATLDHARNLRTTSFDLLLGGTWERSSAMASTAEVVSNLNSYQGTVACDLLQESRTIIENPVSVQFSVQMFQDLRAPFPVPNTILNIDQPADAIIEGDGTVHRQYQNSNEFDASGSIIQSTVAPGDSSHPEVLKCVRYSGNSSTDPRVLAFTLKVIAGKKTDWDKAVAIKEAISKQCNYSLDAPAVPSGEDPVAYFLFDSREGYCDLFATAMVTMARAAGLNSRYSVGYLTDDSDRDGLGHLFIRANESHAWAELEFNGEGWLPFDATEGAQDVTPSSSINWGRIAINGGVATAVIGILFGVIYGIKKARWERSPQRAVNESHALWTQIAKLYGQFSKNLEKFTGADRPISTTPIAWLSTVGFELGNLESEAISLAHEFNRHLYGPDEITPSNLKELKLKVKDFNSKLSKIKRKKGKLTGQTRVG